MSKTSFAQRLLNSWDKLHTKPGGKLFFSFLVGRLVPYSGTVKAYVAELRPGYAKLTMKDRRKLRNHLGSVHAISLANLGELTTGLAAMAGMPPNTRAILRKLDVSYEKKAHGLLTSTCTTQLDPPTENIEHSVKAEIRNQADEVVAIVTTLWVVGPEKRDT